MNLKKDKEQKRNSKDRLLASQMENQDFISVGGGKEGPLSFADTRRSVEK